MNTSKETNKVNTEKKVLKESHKTDILTCTEGYQIEFTYLDDDNATLKLIKDGETTTYQMKHVPSGSGAKYKSEKEDLVFWSHQDEASLSQGGKDLCKCSYKE